MKYNRTLTTGAIILIVILFAAFWKGDFPWAQSLQPSKDRQNSQKKKRSKKAISKNLSAIKRSPTVFVKGPQHQREDISATLARISRGEKFPHRNDGSIFQNREKRLPKQKRGYYHEYVHPTQGRKGPGAQRIIIGLEKDVFYTPDHYKSFQRVNLKTKGKP